MPALSACSTRVGWCVSVTVCGLGGGQDSDVGYISMILLRKNVQIHSWLHTVNVLLPHVPRGD